MEKIIPTRGISRHLEIILTEAEKEIILISPFIQFPKQLYNRMVNASDRGVKITIVYGIKELKPKQEKQLLEIDNLQVLYGENMHAKVYLNENVGIISSMNLYDFSEVNNFELGVYFENDEKSKQSLYSEAYREAQLIISGCEVRKKYKTEEENDARVKSILQSQSNNNFEIKDYPIKGIVTTTHYGFVTYNLKGFSSSKIKKIKKETETVLRDSLNGNYRMYWSSPYEKICIYHKKKIKFETEKEEREYCSRAIKLLNDLIQKEFEI